ncbi:CbtA family protein [Jiella avicenniae]|uniref:CbtA family protein n=1 Tax=Jiella avicenniae TaxID=2907202 RepID=A0A9X1P431_9HYPH|nr:CbtA family protein [Jiella avicenniae]MCE7028911.1 CbtA family protein [Jiella avicenniae]
MLVRYLLAALAAGLFVGILMTPVHYLKLVPLIEHAEIYERGGHGSAPTHEHRASLVSSADAHGLSGHEAGRVVLVHGPAAAEGEEGGASPFESRALGTLTANLVTGAGFALILGAVALLAGHRITLRTGALWGLAGFAAISLAPALGLPPELPAMPVADLAMRQTWWITTVALTAAGLYCLVLKRQPVVRAGGALLLVVPHLFAAPHPADLSSPIPPTLAAEFAVASLATGALFWVLLGLSLGAAMDRFVGTEA